MIPTKMATMNLLLADYIKYEDFPLCRQKLDLQRQVTQDAKTAYPAREDDLLKK